ncbi:MAG: hybrid sensor histidine kinase/response regulator transcription factor [Bacteroidales bacterium]
MYTFGDNNTYLSFSNLTLKDGLSQSTVFDIKQDKTGYIWFATADGLNQFDGYQFTVYRTGLDSVNSIHSNFIRSLEIDSTGNLWIGSKLGLSQFDTKKQTFENYPLTILNLPLCIYDIEQINSEYLALGCDGGVAFFNMRTRQFDYQHVFGREKVNELYYTGNNTLIVGTTQGLFSFNIKTKSIKAIVPNLSNTWIQEIYPKNNGEYWVATEGKGLYLINANNEIKTAYKHDPSNANSLSSDFVRTISYDFEGKLWIGTFNGLNVLNERTGSFQKYYHNEHDAQSISQNSVRSIFMDSQGGMWMGTYFGGINYHHALRDRFKHIRSIPSLNTLNDRVISCIVEDPSGEIWIGTNDNGVNITNLDKENSFRYFRTKENNHSSLQSNNIKCIYPISENEALVGSHGGGLARVNKNTGHVINWLKSNSSIVSNNVYSIIKTDDVYWIGTLNGLCFFDGEGMVKYKNDKNLESFFNDKPITYLMKDTKDRVWIGTARGLFCYNLKSNELKSYYHSSAQRSLSSDYITCIIEDRKQRVWIGTENGLNRFNDKNGNFQVYDEKKGLSNSFVHGVIEDDYNRLWISTNNGLTCLEQDSKVIRNYFDTDGLQSNQFTTYSFCKTSKGLFLFGGINGITLFSPDKLMDNPFSPKPEIIDLKLFNKSVVPGDETELLSKSISLTDKVEFSASQNVFSLRFVSINYLATKGNTFAYKLEGFDKDWYVTTNREVSYSNLSPGKYIFKVKSANNDGKWNNDPTELTIVINPVWYRTWWALIIWGFLFIILIYIVIHIMSARARMQNEIEYQKLEHHRMEEMNELQLRFFINISHEFRTPLTMILSPLQEIIDRGVANPWMRQQLDYMQRNTKKMLHLVNQFLDYRRAELGVLELRTKYQEVNTGSYDVYALFDKVAKQRNIDYIFDCIVKDRYYQVDMNYVERILSNLLSNAFKYTPEGGRIVLSIYERGDNIVFQVSDTGKGIPEDKQQKIFERFYQENENQMGTGIGLSFVRRLVMMHHGAIEVESEVGNGSTFRIVLPALPESYPDEEKDQNIQSVDFATTQSVQENVDALATSSTMELDEHTESKKLGTILIVEDNQEVRDYLGGEFSFEFHVLKAENGEEALKLMKNQLPDLIISDVMMPVMDGFKFCKAVKQNIKTCHIPVIMLTAKTNIEEQKTGLEMGADDYLSKPFVFSILSAKVHNLLKMRERIRSYYANSEQIEPEKITFNAMDEEFLRKAIDIVQKNLDNVEFTVDEFSRELAMSRSSLHLKLKAIVGDSANEFIRKIRMEHACKLLKEGRYSIAEISVMVGFNTPSYFATSFKKHMGCLPTEYIKNYKG